MRIVPGPEAGSGHVSLWPGNSITEDGLLMCEEHSKSFDVESEHMGGYVYPTSLRLSSGAQWL